MILETNYETGSDPGTGLTRYMGRDGHELRDHTGRTLDDDEIQQFNERAAENEFSRQLVLAPDRDDLSDQELDRAVRQTMNDWTGDHNDTEYVYSVHEDDGNNHVHVAATSGDSNDLWMDKPDIRELRDDVAAEKFQDYSLDRQQEREQSHDRDLSPSLSDVAPSQAATRMLDGTERLTDRDRDRDLTR